MRSNSDFKKKKLQSVQSTLQTGKKNQLKFKYWNICNQSYITIHLNALNLHFTISYSDTFNHINWQCFIIFCLFCWLHFDLLSWCTRMVTHHPLVGCRKLHKHFITKNIQRSEGNTKNKRGRQTETHTQMRKDIFSSLLLGKVSVLLYIRISSTTLLNSYSR